MGSVLLSLVWLLVAGILVVAAALALLLLPAAHRLAGRKRLTLDGITTLEDAVAACRRTGLQGWDLVIYAQRLVYRKFTCYSCRNLWDTPSLAFAFGMGYCTQYNLALKRILDRLGFQTEAVSSLRVYEADNPAWTMGHTWLRVTLDGESKDVCAGRSDNLPGHNAFVPVRPVWRGNELIFFFTNLGMILFCGFLEWRSLLTRRPTPAWMFQERRTG